MSLSRRTWLQGGLVAGALLAARRRLAADDMPMPAQPVATVERPKAPAGEHYAPVIVPDGRTLPFDKRDGVKIFHLVAEPVKHTFAPGLDVEAWGYNGATPGPLIEAVVGDRVRIYVTNKLPSPRRRTGPGC